MIELTHEMRRAVKGRMGIPDGVELDPWMEAAIADVLALVERDHTVRPRFGPPPHAFVRSDDPSFGSAFGGACAFDINGVTCGWPEQAHRRSASCPCGGKP